MIEVHSSASTGPEDVPLLWAHRAADEALAQPRRPVARTTSQELHSVSSENVTPAEPVSLGTIL